jgi:hypothetical protein
VSKDVYQVILREIPELRDDQPLLTALLRAYRVGHARFSEWLLEGLAQQAGDADMICAAALSMSRTVAGYIDQTSEAMVSAYTRERENWLRNRSASRSASAGQAATRASRPVSSCIPTATFARAAACCRPWCAQNSSSSRPGSSTRT